MRLLVTLQTSSEMAVTDEVNYKIRGLLWNYLENTMFSSLHSSSNIPTFTFSNIFPEGGFTNISETFSEGQKCQLMISSPHDQMVNTIKQKLEQVESIEIGDYKFSVMSVEPLMVDVGGVGSTGVVKTSTGLYLRLPEEEREKYGIEVDYEGVISWVPDFGLDVFRERFMDNILWKLDKLRPHMGNPSSFSDLFKSIEILTVMEKELNVTEDHRKTFISPVCQFEYHIATESQQTWLNLLLDSGLGWRNSLGIGFTNVVESDKENNPYIGQNSIHN